MLPQISSLLLSREQKKHQPARMLSAPATGVAKNRRNGALARIAVPKTRAVATT